MIGSSKKLLMGAAGRKGPEPMVLVFDTTLATGTTVTIPLAGTVNVVVDWGDGASDTYTTSGNKTHTYAAEGEYTVEISGSLTGFGANVSRPNFTKCLSFGDLGLTSLISAFNNCANFIEAPSALAPGVTGVGNMFRDAVSFNYDIGDWDTSSVSSMTAMFFNASSFNQDIGKWDVSQVSAMNSTFDKCSSFNQNIGSWDVSNVTNMASMFLDATNFNQDIGLWDMGAVTNVNSMFRNASAFNQDLSGIVTGVAAQPSLFSSGANATFADNANGLKPFLADGVTQITS